MIASARHCPCCDQPVAAFLPFGVRPRDNARCPHCGALERHRLLTLFLRGGAVPWRRGARLLHVAPEPALRRLFQRVPDVTYLPADLDPTHGIRLDVTALPFADGSLDAIVCNHVLEHVPDDRLAMREFRRTLRAGGWAVLQSPVDRGRTDTFEDATVTAPAERERVFGQWDHVRVYGTDYATRMAEAGLHVQVLQPREAIPGLDAATIQCFGLRPEPIYLCRA